MGPPDNRGIRRAGGQALMSPLSDESDGRTLVAQVEPRQPDVVRLATLVSLAVRVEPGLLRRARLSIAPDIATAVEAQLWFSPLVASRTPSAIVLEPGVAAHLRRRLVDSRDPKLSAQAWAVREWAHRDAPPTLRLEEDIIWQSLSAATDAQLADLLASAVTTMTDGSGRGGGIARWALRALPTLPAATRESTTGHLLMAGAQANLGLPAQLSPDTIGHPALASILPDGAPKLDVGLRLLRRGIEVSEPPAPGSSIVRVPHTEPVVLRVRPQGDAREHVVTVPRASVERHSVGTRPFASAPAGYDIELADGRIARLEHAERLPPAAQDAEPFAAEPTVDPRLERHRPALVYDAQEAYRAMSAASITAYPGNALKRRDGQIVARVGEGLSLALLSGYDVREGDRLDEAGDPLPAARRFQADPAFSERVYGRVKEDGGRVWLQYWLWFYYTPRQVLGFGKHEGGWELVQIGLGDDGSPEVMTVSQREGAEGRDWPDVRRQGDNPVVYVAPHSHACYFEPGTHAYAMGVDNPGGVLAPVVPRVEPFGAWVVWPGRWGNSTGVGGGRFGGRSPLSPGRQGQQWDHPASWHARARAATPLRRARGVVRAAGAATYPKLLEVAARREDGRVGVDYKLDPTPRRRASRLLVTLHREGAEDQLLGSFPMRVSSPNGTVEVALPAGAEGDIVVRASAYNVLRQRSDPLETIASDVRSSEEVP